MSGGNRWRLYVFMRRFYQLQRVKLSVPKIFFVSTKNRIIIEEFIEGEDLSEPVKRIIGSKPIKKDLTLVKEVGRTIAKVHNLGVSLGDCKPENFIVHKEEIFLLDLEQAKRDG